MPRSFVQYLEGGWTCPSCGLEINADGRSTALDLTTAPILGSVPKIRSRLNLEPPATIQDWHASCYFPSSGGGHERSNGTADESSLLASQDERALRRGGNERGKADTNPRTGRAP